MNLKNKFLKLVCCAFIIPQVGLQAQSDTLNLSVLTFEQAASFMSLNNFALKQSDKLIQQKEQELKASRGLYLPNISLSANYVAMSDDIHLDMSPIQEAISPLYETLGNFGNFSGVPNPDPNTSGAMPFLPDDISTQVVRAQMLEGLDHINSTDWNQIIQKKQFGVVNANFVMPIYTGGKINAANKAAKIEFEEAHVQRSVKQDELFCNLVEVYFGVVLSNHAVNVRQEVYNTMQEHLSDAEKLKTNGMISNAEYLHAVVYCSESERELKKAIRNNTITIDALLNTLSIDTLGEIKPVSQLFYQKEIESLNYYLEKGKQNSELLELIKHKKDLAQQGYKVEKANYLPTIAAMGTYVVADKDFSPYMPDYTVGVGLNWTVFDGTARSKKVKAAKYRQDQVDRYYSQTELDISLAIHKYHQEVNMQLEQLIDLESASKFASEYSRVRKKAFSEGMATSTEVSDANLALAKVKIEKLQAIYNYDVSIAKLLYYSGILSEFGNYQNGEKTLYCEF